MNFTPAEDGQANLARVQAHLASLKASGSGLPMRGDRVNIDQLAKACGLKTRGPFYTNKAVQAALAEFQGVQPADDPALSRALDDTGSRLMKAEQKIASQRAEIDALKAENKALQQEVERQRAVQEVALLGRRVKE
jgi:uncharacterized protein YccT (UPF0319 family)